MSFGQVTRTASELAPPLPTTTTRQREDYEPQQLSNTLEIADQDIANIFGGRRRLLQKRLLQCRRDWSKSEGSIPGFQECDEKVVETWIACDAEDCGFQILNDDEIVTSVDSCGMIRTTIRVLSYSTTAAQENQRPCSEKTKVYNGGYQGIWNGYNGNISGYFPQ
ncbi:uncharacterized protein TNCV_3658991 [Trichonephila clavipes]|nr:uncharacterized protein TNCV_3658991 [Trichonephila clavipes]